MSDSSSSPPLACQLCSDPINTELDDHIEAICSNANCKAGGAHVECAIQYCMRLINPGVKGQQKKKTLIQRRPHQEVRGHLCWFSHTTGHQCDGRILDADWVKAHAQVLKKEKKLAELLPAPAPKPKPRKKGPAHPQPQTRGPASGGVQPVGRKHDIEIKPLAARDNRLGTSGSNKLAVNGANGNKAKNLTMCPYIQSSVGQCPLHQCAFAHSEEEIAKNEQFAREKTQLQRVKKASKKDAKRNGSQVHDVFEELPEGAVEFAESLHSASMNSSIWNHPQDGWPASTHTAADDGGGWTEVGTSGTVVRATNGHSTSNGVDHSSNASAGSRVPSLLVGQLQPAAPLLGPAASHEIIRFKLNSCTARLTQLGVTWPIAEAAAKATGAEDNAAAELIFSGTDQAAWGDKEVDIAGEIAQALALMEPPVSASRPQVEQAIVAARGNMADVVQELRQQMSNGATSQLLSNGPPSPPPALAPPPANPTSSPPTQHPPRALSTASSNAASTFSAATASGAPPAAFNEDEWLPKWEDDKPAASAAPSLQPVTPEAAPPPQQQLPLPPQQAPQLWSANESNLAAPSDVVVGPATPPELPPPLVAASPVPTVDANAHIAASPLHGAEATSAFAGNLAPASQQPLMAPAAPQQLAADMSVLDLGRAPPQHCRPQEAAATAAAQQPEDFEDLLDLLMT